MGEGRIGGGLGEEGEVKMGEEEGEKMGGEKRREWE